MSAYRKFTETLADPKPMPGLGSLGALDGGHPQTRKTPAARDEAVLPLKAKNQVSTPAPPKPPKAPNPRTWAEGYAALCAMPPPAGFSLGRWQRIVDAAGAFLDRWGETAIACNWSTLDLFGCDSAAPDRRFDCMGLVLLLDRREVVAVDEDGADLITVTGATQRFRRRPPPPGTIPLWELAR